MDGLVKALENYEATVPKTEHWLDDSSKVEVSLGDLRKLRDTKSLRPILSRTHTSTYSILEVKPSTWQDIHDRLKEVDMLKEYLDDDVIVFGTVGVRAAPEDDGETPGAISTREAAFMALAHSQGGAMLYIPQVFGATHSKYSPVSYEPGVDMQALIGMQQKGLVELTQADETQPTHVRLTKKGLRVVKMLEIEVTINCRKMFVPCEVSYEDVCRLSFPEETRPAQFDDVWTCTYYGKAPGVNLVGSMTKGQTVRVVWGMSFTCMDTGRA
jgi:hypothetical protein